MKKNWKIPVLAVSFCAVAALCVLGGQFAVDKVNADRLADLKAQTDELITPQADKPKTVIAPISITTPPPAKTPEPKPTGSETVTVEPNGDITITRDWSQNTPDPNATPNTTVESNMGGSGGGKLDMDENGTWHGDNPGKSILPTPTATPSATPVPTKAPTATPKPETTPNTVPDATPAPTATPKPEKPAGSETTPPEQDGTSSKPTYNGTNGEMSGDGQWQWIDGFGWLPPQAPATGEMGGNGDGAGLSDGETIGIM